MAFPFLIYSDSKTQKMFLFLYPNLKLAQRSSFSSFGIHKPLFS